MNLMMWRSRSNSSALISVKLITFQNLLSFWCCESESDLCLLFLPYWYECALWMMFGNLPLYLKGQYSKKQGLFFLIIILYFYSAKQYLALICHLLLFKKRKIILYYFFQYLNRATLFKNPVTGAIWWKETENHITIRLYRTVFSDRIAYFY